MLAYAIKSAIFLSIMYIPYMLILRKESFFHFNRILLVSIMLLSLILPLCDFHSLSIENNPIQEGMIIIGTPTAVMENGGNATTTESFNWFVLVFYLYIIGLIATLIWKIVQLAVLYRTIHNCVLWKDEQDGITIYCHAHDIAPFSWLNNIVISEDDYNNNSTEILRHELGHIMHHHSLDIILANIIQTIQWWNPFSWLIASSLCDVHEYEADDAVLTSGVNIRQYQTLLISKAVANTNYTFANNFNHSLLKKRITMMIKEKSNPWMRTKALYIIPIAAIALCAFATPELNRQVNKITEKVNEAEKESIESFSIPMRPKEKKNEKKVYELDIQKEAQMPPVTGSDLYIYGPAINGKDLDVLPNFPDGETAMFNHFKENIKYQTEEDTKGIRGDVVVSCVVERDGSISHTQIAKGLDPLIDKDAVRVVSSIPKMTPGKLKGGQVVRSQISFVIPFPFEH